MLLADDDFFARQGDVDGLGLELLCEGGRSDGFAALLDDGLDLGAHVVDHLADGRALLGRNVLHALEQGSQLALFAEEAHTRIVERTRVRGSGKLLLGGLQNALQLFFHVFILLWNVILQLERSFLRVSAYKWVLHCKTIKTGSMYHGFDTPTQPPGAASGGIGNRFLQNRFPYIGGMDTPYTTQKRLSSRR